MNSKVQGPMRPTAYCLLSLLLVLTASALILSRSSIPNKSNRVGSFATASYPQSAAAATAKLPQASKQQIVASYGRLPLSFETNQGQTNRQVKFLSRGRGYSLFLTPTEMVLVLNKTTGHEARHSADAQTSLQGEAQQTPFAVLRIQLVGANAAPRISGLGELPGKSNYFIGNDPAKWRTNVPTYAGVKYREVCPGVDLVYYGNQEQLEHDFVVAPGTDPRRLRLRLKGAEKVSLNAQGDLVLQVAGGKVQLEKPVLYQEEAGTRRKVSGGYLLARNNEVGFDVGSYDLGRPLVIDPVLSYSTYLGGTSNDSAFAIAVDSSGNAYVTGFTDSADFPTMNPAQPAKLGGETVFVAKLNAAGNALVYSTYLGGSGGDAGFGIAVDPSGSAYVTGSTKSTDFPTTSGAFQRSFRGGIFEGDAFVTKLSGAGNALAYSTYLGGSSDDIGFAVAVDASGNAYVTGGTTSMDFPTANPFQATNHGNEDAFITKLNSGGSALVYSTYLGGSGLPPGNAPRGSEFGAGIVVDSSGNAYLTGRTTSTDFPTTAGTFQLTCSTCGPANLGGFVTKLSTSGSALVYSTYLAGTTGGTGSNAIAIDSSGNAYVTGETAANDFPTVGPLQASNKGGGDAFVTKLNATGSALLYSTFLGGSAEDDGFGIAVDSLGNADVAGRTKSTDFPTANPLQASNHSTCLFCNDAFVAKLNASGSSLIYSTYLGGSADDQGRSIAADALGNAYVAGFTCSTDFPTTAGAFQTSNRGGCDAFIAKIIDFAFPSSGSFVIGNLNAVVGNAVTFWGTHWAEGNSLSGGPAPAAFKGFADTAPRSCGGSWTSDPGNSSNPPATVPSFMAVIASSAITMSGATISGNVPKIVIVKTDPGYGPTPGQTGTGTVVAVFCGS